MRAFKTKWFNRFAKANDITDEKLARAVHELENGLIDADYGGGLLKKRVARDGSGKSGGYRSIVAFKSGDKCIFIYCFAKSDKSNLTQAEKREYKKYAAILCKYSKGQIDEAITNGILLEVKYNG